MSDSDKEDISRLVCACVCSNMDQNVGFSDSVLLENESEAAFISNLQLRFKRDYIFVRWTTSNFNLT